MDQSEQELYDHVSDNLMELIWRARYPIDSGVATWCVLEGFRQNGFDVSFNHKEAILTTGKVVGEKAYSLQARMTQDELLDAWKRGPKGTPFALYDSICAVYDELGNHFTGLKDRNEWCEIRTRETRIVRDTMEDSLELFLRKYQENILVSANGKPTGATEPTLFREVLDKYPISLYDAAKLSTAICGPCAEYVLETDFAEFDPEKYHPSAWAMREVFWGQYLDALAEAKGYPLRSNTNRLRSLIISGYDALTPGHVLWQSR